VSRLQPARKSKPKRRRRFRSLSDPRTLSELALRLKEGIYITTLDGEIIDANPAFMEMFGVDSLSDLKGYRTGDFVRPEVRAREMAQLEREGSVRDFEFQLTRRDGEIRTVVDSAFLSIDPETGEKYCHGVLVDITQRKELQTQLLELSIRDPLTGCYNRRYLNTVTRQCEAQPKGEWGCIYLDIDHFKQYNDRNGHAEGDAILVKMARFLMRHVRAEEAVVGGWRRVPGGSVRFRRGPDGARSGSAPVRGGGIGAGAVLDGMGGEGGVGVIREHDDSGRPSAAGCTGG